MKLHTFVNLPPKLMTAVLRCHTWYIVSNRDPLKDRRNEIVLPLCQLQVFLEQTRADYCIVTTQCGLYTFKY